MGFAVSSFCVFLCVHPVCLCVSTCVFHSMCLCECGSLVVSLGALFEAVKGLWTSFLFNWGCPLSCWTLGYTIWWNAHSSPWEALILDLFSRSRSNCKETLNIESCVGRTWAAHQSCLATIPETQGLLKSHTPNSEQWVTPVSGEGKTPALHQGLFFELEDVVTQHLCPVFITGRLAQSFSSISSGSSFPVLELCVTLPGMDSLLLFSWLVLIRKMSVWLCFHRHTCLEIMSVMLCCAVVFSDLLVCLE